MQVPLIIAICAFAAVIFAALLHFWISGLTEHRDETEGVHYSALRGFLQNAAETEADRTKAG
jgi:hypothetical protein